MPHYKEMRYQNMKLLSYYHLDVEDLNAMFRQYILSLLDKYREAQGKIRVAEKTPGNIQVFWLLHEVFPDSPLIQVIRDGRDVVSSLLTMSWYDSEGNATKPTLDYCNDAIKAAEYWKDCIELGRWALKQGDQYPNYKNRYYELRYEDLIHEPEKTLRPLFEFLEEPWDPVVLDYYKKDRALGDEASKFQVDKPLYTNSLARWKKDLSQADQYLVLGKVGELLKELGYWDGQ
jgi:hypothetical protein